MGSFVGSAVFGQQEVDVETKCHLAFMNRDGVPDE